MVDDDLGMQAALAYLATRVQMALDQMAEGPPLDAEAADRSILQFMQDGVLHKAEIRGVIAAAPSQGEGAVK